MPSGYTSSIYEGENPTFKEFALKAARGMGAFIHQRDESLETGIRMREVDKHYPERLSKARVGLIKAQQMSTEDARIGAAREFQEERDHAYKNNERAARLEHDYRAMLMEVHEWHPPTPEHIGFKQFMVDQLTDSLNFDVHFIDEDAITQKSPEEYKADQIQRAERELKWATESYELEVKNTNGSNQWASDLIESLNG